MNPAIPPDAAPTAGVRGAWTRIADVLTGLISHGLLALCARVALGAVFFLSGRTKVDGLLTVSDSA